MIYGFLSDAHGNCEAFSRGVSVLRSAGAQRFVFLGDAVGYLPGGSVVDALQVSGMEAIRGNHEEMLIEGRFDAERDAIYQLKATRTQMDAASLCFLESWPTHKAWNTASGAVLLVHGSPADHTRGYVYPDTDLATFDVPDGTTVFMGHTHRPFVAVRGAVRYVNIGSCGLPRDAGHLGCAALFDDETGDVRVIRFDIREATKAALARVGHVHSNVLAVFDRPTPADLVGELHAL